MPNPTVSVILPCYNAHRYLTRALDSVRAQTFRDFEIIVVDDGSTDPETVTYLNQLPSDIRLVRQENRGLAGARNRGFAEARASYVVPLDCDDWLEPTFIEKTLAALEAAPERAFAFAQMVLEGDAVGQLVKHYNFFEQMFFNQLPYCLLVRKSAWAAVGGYDELMREGYEDWEFNIHLGSIGETGVEVPESLFHYWVSVSGMLLSRSTNIHDQLWRSIRRKHHHLYRPGQILMRWRQWRRSPSTYALWLYLPWLLAHMALPPRLLGWVFRNLLMYSHSRRVSARRG